MENPLEILASLHIEHQTFEHPPLFTTADSHLQPPMPGVKNKNLFLKDEKGKQYFLVSLTQDKQLNLKTLGQRLGVKGLGFASPERLKNILGIEPGSVGLLALVNDTQKLARVYIDQDLLDPEWFQSHPLLNTSTVCFRTADIKKFLDHTGHHFEGINL